MTLAELQAVRDNASMYGQADADFIAVAWKWWPRLLKVAAEANVVIDWFERGQGRVFETNTLKDALAALEEP